MMEVMSPTLLNATVVEAFHAWMVRVRVDTMVREVAKTRFTFFLGICVFFQTGEMVVVRNDFCLDFFAK